VDTPRIREYGQHGASDIEVGFTEFKKLRLAKEDGRRKFLIIDGNNGLFLVGVHKGRPDNANEIFMRFVFLR